LLFLPNHCGLELFVGLFARKYANCSELGSQHYYQVFKSDLLRVAAMCLAMENANIHLKLAVA